MSRLIDADAFWKHFEEGKAKLLLIKSLLPPEMIDATLKIYAEIKEMIDSMPTIEPEPHWIPCSEKPDRRDVYRVTVQCEHVDGYPDYEVCYGEYDEENGWFLLGEPVGRIKMVAWMRIDYVEPYQPEEK